MLVLKATPEQFGVICKLVGDLEGRYISQEDEPLKPEKGLEWSKGFVVEFPKIWITTSKV